MTTKPRLRDEVIVGTHPTTWATTVYVLPGIPDGAPYAIREGIARRRLTALEGRCPCGAVAVIDAQPGTVGSFTVEHEDRCPAITETLTKAIRRWQR